ncbi:FKBP-type peptidyl-prolyl cis-trans isomerase [Candidatus Saccharibacteria bacterium]|nr:FKBP-type peptidyl-prolyl cis-trans isomerase [Candidatus Saccharibacteria bacterium]
MDEKELRTSPKQRLFIILIAIFMVGSIVASYAAIVISGAQGNASSAANEVDEAKVAEYSEAYSQLAAEFSAATQDDFNKFIQYKSNVTAYNETAANADGVQTEDLVAGTGREIGENDSDYLAYYVGWCADESIFDSSYNDNSNPTAFAKILNASLGMIEGWNLGVEGMRIDGIRVITVPGELAYGDQMEICGGTNKPLKFMIMPKEKSGELYDLSTKLDEAYMRYQYALYGIDYDSIKANSE